MTDPKDLKTWEEIEAEILAFTAEQPDRDDLSHQQQAPPPEDRTLLHVVSVRLTAREQQALMEIRQILGIVSDEAAILAGLWKLASWADPNADPDLFRLKR